MLNYEMFCFEDTVEHEVEIGKWVFVVGFKMLNNPEFWHRAFDMHAGWWLELEMPWLYFQAVNMSLQLTFVSDDDEGEYVNSTTNSSQAKE